MNERPSLNKSTRKTVILLFMLAILMFGFGFALVPFYNMLCKTIGINGKTNTSSLANDQVPDLSRWITIQFVASTNAGLPWDFYPLVKQIKIHPGENEKVAFYAKNNANVTMTVQAIPSVTPGNIAKYLKKTECFCFTRQTFKAGEARDMPVLFHIDRSVPSDIHVITLSYTMFDTAGLNGNSSSKTAGKIN